MMQNNATYLFFVTSVLIFISCDNKVDSTEFTMVDTGIQYDLHSIEIIEDNIYVTGGDVWNKSFIARTKDGSSWSVDSLSDKSIFDLTVVKQKIIGVGNEGYVFEISPQRTFHRTKHWGLLKSIAPTVSGMVAVGGRNFSNGWIYTFNDLFQIDTTYLLSHDLTDVTCHGSECVAVGFGIIMTSSDNGITWIQSAIDGDFYTSISDNQKDGYVIAGNNGSILKKTYDKEEWTIVKDGHSPLNDNPAFLKLKFDSSGQGIIVGEKGLIYRSEDYGETWNDISIDFESDLYDIAFYKDEILLPTENGILIRLAG